MAPRKINEQQRSMLEDFFQRMTLSAAAKAMNLRVEQLRAGIERGELKYIQMPGSSRKQVTPALVAAWIDEYCVKQELPIAS